MPAAGSTSNPKTASKTMDGRIQERGTVTPPRLSTLWVARS
jgi:hypothetical protein